MLFQSQIHSELLFVQYQLRLKLTETVSQGTLSFVLSLGDKSLAEFIFFLGSKWPHEQGLARR
jgi:hypothetical protein